MMKALRALTGIEKLLPVLRETLALQIAVGFPETEGMAIP